MDHPRLNTLGTLAQYILVARLASLALTVLTLARAEAEDAWLLFPLAVLLGLNYLALRRWPAAVSVLGIARKPHYLALDAGLAATMLAVVGAGAPLVLYLVGTVALGGLVYPRTPTVIAQFGVFGAFELVQWSHIGYLPGASDVHTLVTLPALLLSGGFAGAAVRRLITQNERASDDITALQAEAAVREERLRLARDLHDTVTKNLHGVWLVARGLDAALTRGDHVTARASAALIASTAGELATHSRDVISGLREDGDASRPLDEALGDVARRAVAGQEGLAVRVQGRPRTRLDSEVRHELMAIVAEALHNTVKHARAGAVDVLLDGDGTALTVKVVDDGRGFDGAARTGHYGLTGMHERAQRVGGELSIRSDPGAGTRVQITVPAAGFEPGGAAERSGGLREPAASA
jgi:signal transduction histidine kinase